MGKPAMAVTHLCAALQQDPLLWCAYEELCLLGEAPHTLLGIVGTASTPLLLPGATCQVSCRGWLYLQ